MHFVVKVLQSKTNSSLCVSNKRKKKFLLEVRQVAKLVLRYVYLKTDSTKILLNPYHYNLQLTKAI